jgi:DNA polymerase sigma
MNTLNDSQLKQQDFVDNAIYELLHNINPSQREIEWNIEMIGGIRDLIRLWFVERLAITDEMTFYPYIDADS